MKKTLQECKEIVAKERDVIHKHFWNEELTDLSNKMYYEQSEWISVEDNYPEYGQYVLVQGIDDKMYGIKNCHVCEMNDLEDGLDYIDKGIFYWLTERGTEITKVAHWQPLPSIPIL